MVLRKSHTVRTYRTVFSNYKKIIILKFCFAILAVCIIVCNEKKLKDQEHPAKLVVHYKNDKDRSYTTLQMRDSFALLNYPFVSIPDVKTISKKNEITYIFKIDSPKLVMLGFSEYVLFPDDSLDISYEVVTKTREKFVEKVTKNNGMGIQVCLNGDVKYFNMSYFDSLKKLPLNEFLKKYTINNIDRLARNSIDSFQINSKEKKSNPIELFNALYSYYVGIYFNNFFNSRYDQFLGLAYNEKKKFALQVFDMGVWVSQHTLLDMNNREWFYFKQMISRFLAPFIKEKETKFMDTILKKSYNPIVKDYMYYQIIEKNAQLNNVLDNNLFYVNINNKYLKEKAFHFLLPVQNRSDMLESIGKELLYKTDKSTITFEKIFKEGNEKYLYFDFCGTWCKPCLKEMENYKADEARLSKFKNLKKVWIFFENENSSWVECANRYGLPLSNCYAITSSTKLKKYFNSNFYWQEDFPHHFIFNKKGQIHEQTAPSLHELKANELFY